MNVLFLCVANSARSQMAEGLARAVLGKDFSIQSAGSSPSFVHPLAIQVMQELGIDISQQKSKSVSEINVNSIGLVITLCQEEVCPTLPRKTRVLHWSLMDPAAVKGPLETQLKAFRSVRDEIYQKLKTEFGQSEKTQSA